MKSIYPDRLIFAAIIYAAFEETTPDNPVLCKAWDRFLEETHSEQLSVEDYLAEYSNGAIFQNGPITDYETLIDQISKL